jgi:hypothetical protein
VRNRNAKSTGALVFVEYLRALSVSTLIISMLLDWATGISTTIVRVRGSPTT